MHARDWAKRNAGQQREYTRKWRTENRERHQAYGRKGQRKRYGILNATGETKTGPCEICAKHCKLCFDHDHSTGLFRGWLCHACNKGIGHFRDAPELLMKAARYLQQSPTVGPLASAPMAPALPGAPTAPGPPQLAA